MDTETSNEEPAYVVDLDKLPQPQLTGHMWMQYGIELRCQSCAFAHGDIPRLPDGTPALIDYQYIGNDENGNPKYQKITRR